MDIPFLDRWRKRRDSSFGAVAFSEGSAGSESRAALAQLLSECELLRSQVSGTGLRLDDSAASLEALDQLLPRWRDDEETLTRLGNDVGLYLGTVVVRTVPGAGWEIGPGGRPVVRLASGREIDVVTAGHDWAGAGAPELSQLYAEIAEV
ncbi:DUF6278 family protein [Streptomyces sp. NPDC088337]|uniref:DUF6278 family protein n=1 Tax=unclassified Streptomyces TaxID=2593676 RepID=UPI000C26DD56|nr:MULTISPECIES: DUF6278 family protein [unclassified Streptomyces]PJM97536.1 hypothetical protein CG719_01125 [Streptomyces sp. CB01373]WSB29581.1 DUF6278 family protein [Streptomyces sp. NBC_01788]